MNKLLLNKNFLSVFFLNVTSNFLTIVELMELRIMELRKHYTY